MVLLVKFYRMRLNMSKAVLVLQGEYAVVDSSKIEIKTSQPLICHILVVHEKKSNLLGLAHIDCYTSGRKITEQLFESFEKRLDALNVTLPYDFDIQFGQGLPYVGSSNTDGDDLDKNCEQIMAILSVAKKYAQRTNIIRLPKHESQRTPLTVSVQKGNLVLESIPLQSTLSQNLQLLQGKEYFHFNDFLDRCFGDINQNLLPYFEGKEATRNESEFQNLTNSPNQVVRCDVSERSINSLVQYERTVCVKKEKLVELQDIVRSLPEDTQVRLERVLVLRQYNLLLRMSVVDKNGLPLLQFLLRNVPDFGLDSQSKGKKSGTASDVATRNNNREALDCLGLFQREASTNLASRADKTATRVGGP